MQVPETLRKVNALFNRNLRGQIKGILTQGYVYQLGRPGEILMSVGMPDLPIELTARVLSQKAGKGNKHFHPFELSEVKNLPKAINDPVAVFAYGDRTKAVNVITKIEQGAKRFLVGISLNPEVGGVRMKINSVSTVFPKDVHEWLNWISQGKALYMNKKEVSNLLANPRLPEDVTKDPTLIYTINSFSNPPLL